MSYGIWPNFEEDTLIWKISELFAVSLSNVPTNLVVTNISDESINPDYPVVGFFNISSVHGMGNTLDDDEIEKIELYNREW